MPIIESDPVLEAPTPDSAPPQTPYDPLRPPYDPFRPNVCMTSASMADDGTITVTTTKGLTLTFKHEDDVPTHATMTLEDLAHAFALPLDDALLLATMATLKLMDESYVPAPHSFPYNVYLD